MKRKILNGILIFVFALMLVGCGEEESVIPPSEGTVPGENTINNDEVNLYSDDTKLVFDLGAYTAVYYFSGEKITGLEYYFEYPDPATAAVAVSGIRASYTNEDNIESVAQKGNYVFIKFKAAEFEELTTTEIKKTYEYLEEFYNNN